MKTYWGMEVYIRFGAFPASEYNEVFSGYQPGKVVQFCRNQRFEDPGRGQRWSATLWSLKN
jgi:hypothetical protein